MKNKLKKPQTKIQKNSNNKFEKNVESPENLSKMLKNYRDLFSSASFKSSRLKDLISRPSFLRLSQEKQEKITKKYSQALDEYQFAEQAIDQIEFRLSQVT